MSQSIDVDNYGELLAAVNQMTLISYKEYGSYQGDYVALLADDDRMFVYQDSFGSCSGCDWLEDQDLGNATQKRYSVDPVKAFEYCQVKPKYIIPVLDKNNYWLKELIKLLDLKESDL